MKICVLTSSFPSGPGDFAQAPFLLPFIEELKKRQHQVFVFTQNREGRKEESLEGVEVKWFSWMGSKRPLVHLNPLNPLDLLRAGNLLCNGRRALLPFLKEKGIDVCLALWVLPSGFFANCAYRKHGIPYSLWALGSDIYRYGQNPILYPIMRRIIREARGVFADGLDLSKRVEERFKRKCSFLATHRVLLPLPHSFPKRSSEPYRFLFVGRIEKVKGIDLLLKCMASIIEEGLEAKLTIVGKGGMEEWGRNFVRGKGIGNRVEWMGSVSDEKLAWLYQQSDCVVIPSRSESIPLVFSEALSFNKALIVTDVGDMGVLGRQYGVAWVVPAEDPVALKETMKKRVESQRSGNGLSDPQKQEELKRLFNIETSVERFLADYSSLGRGKG